MAKQDEPYRYIICESFRPLRTGGLHGAIHIRSCPNDYYPVNLMVEGSKRLVDEKIYKVDTKFRLKVKLTDRQGGGEFLYTSFRWPEEVVE